LIRTACTCLTAALVLGLSASALAQATSSHPALDRYLSRTDFAISAIGQFDSNVSGTVPANNGAPNAGNNITISPGNTLGAVGTVRYIRKPYQGGEFNYTYARYTETLNNNTTGQPQQPGQIQTGVDEMSGGYVITPPHQIFGLQPFASIGFGSTRFRPTRGGGQGSPIQWRATYYYSVGLQKEFGDSHFGARVSFRQAFFKTPDFLLNYLTINQHTSTVEPTVGFYVRF
jgi:hypothetical protein